MKINHNITAVRTNINLNRTNRNLDSVTYRLSSGYKINQAKDDPAGYAILKRMNRQISGLSQANSNAGDAISAINTAEGALSEIHSILQRMSELSTQAANDTNTPEDRDNIQAEIKQLKEEINRISESTDYNGRKLLNGDSQRTSYVKGSDGKIASGIEILSQSTTVEPGDYSLTVTKDPERAEVTLNKSDIKAGRYNINGELIDITQEDVVQNRALGRIQTVAERCNIELINDNGSQNLRFRTLEYGKNASIDIKYTPASGSEQELGKDTGEDVVADITRSSDGTGFSQSAVTSIDGNVITVTDSNGFELKITTSEGASDEGAVTASVKDASTMQVQVGSESDDMLEVIFEKVSTDTLGISLMNVSTSKGASDAIASSHAAIEQLSRIRSKLGAYTNRFGYAQESAQTQKYNVTSATSSIGDTDMAEDMTNYTQLNVLEQASSSILSKANQRAETILQLLQT